MEKHYGRTAYFSMLDVSIGEHITKEREDAGFYLQKEGIYEKLNSEMEQHKPCIKNPVRSDRWYHSWALHSKSNCYCNSWRFICRSFKSDCSASCLLSCYERTCSHGRGAEDKHGLYRSSLYAW